MGLQNDTADTEVNVVSTIRLTGLGGSSREKIGEEGKTLNGFAGKGVKGQVN